MRWDFILTEVYCADENCTRSLIDHLEWSQGSFCKGDLQAFLYYAVGLRTFLKHYLAELWDIVFHKFRWCLWDRWFWDETAFNKWLEEHTLKPGECPVADSWPPKCKFPEESIEISNAEP